MENNMSLDRKININVPLLKTIVFLIGVIGMFVAGLFYILAGDMLLTIQSLWLMVAIVLSFGSAICAFVSGSFKERKKIMYILKSIALGLAVAFIVFIIIYLTISISKWDRDNPELWDKYNSKEPNFLIKRVRYDRPVRIKTMNIMTVTMVLGAVGLVAQVADLLLTVKLPED